uniref:Protein arginine methyltransferase NDUFAF7 n=1 Tax=Albugo laibachii Nc14 TaxID=890382 RepID=F0WYC2_9STRA|nr:conserved hypothetical protein [Albugo laibachii Nc14]|eukprot:CCA26474.1 conserved hypothetical protein [Albugo laibachii Nc14]
MHHHMSRGLPRARLHRRFSPAITRAFSLKKEKCLDKIKPNHLLERDAIKDPQRDDKYVSIEVDCSAMKSARDPWPGKLHKDMSGSVNSNWNELFSILSSFIDVRGPLTLAEYMQRALAHPTHGYYMKKDVFGAQGDFTTAPEISQMFGELIAIWCIATWKEMGSPDPIHIVELGPGRGSLMSDFLRSSRSFPTFHSALQVHMVEISPALRKIQEGMLKDVDGIRSLQWHTSLTHVPEGPLLVIAQEFFDAMPVHQFEYTERGWCERLIDVHQKNGERFFRFVLSPGPTPAARVLIGHQNLQGLRSGVSEESSVITEQAQIGDQLEISPASFTIMQEIARRISANRGAALIVDYGHNHPSTFSLRGIRNHAFVDALEEPGEIDLSANVDFKTLARYATAEPNISSLGPVPQGLFLKTLGVEHRLAVLLENCESDAQAQELYSAYKRLVDSDQMGTIFKVMAISHSDISNIVGFDCAE